MPLYDFKCEKGHRFERFVKLENFTEAQHCACGQSAERVISAPMFTVENVGYNCPVTGDWIGSQRAHRNNLDRHGCRVLETGETEAAAKFRQNEDDRLDKAIEDTVEKTIDGWDSAKKENLHNELVNGKLDIAVERK